MKYKIVEIFSSIQGEGAHSGRWVTFIRLYGCNLSCGFCDEPLHKQKEAINEMTSEEILEKVLREKCKSVIITGGEPTVYDLHDLVNKLLGLDFWVGIESNGYKPSNIPFRTWFTWSPKEYVVPEERFFSEIKLLVSQENKEKVIDFIHQITRVFDNNFHCYRIYIQPIDEISKEVTVQNYKAALEVSRATNNFLGVQSHKLIGEFMGEVIE